MVVFRGQYRNHFRTGGRISMKKKRAFLLEAEPWSPGLQLPESALRNRARAKPTAEPQSEQKKMNKIAELNVFFWIMKICATTLGETAGDLLSMTLNIGYVLSSLILIGFS